MPGVYEAQALLFNMLLFLKFLVASRKMEIVRLNVLADFIKLHHIQTRALYCAILGSCYGLPWWLSNKESACQCRCHGFAPWVRKIPWRRKWQPIPVLLPGNPMDRGAWRATVHGVARVGHNLVTKQLDSCYAIILSLRKFCMVFLVLLIVRTRFKISPPYMEFHCLVRFLCFSFPFPSLSSFYRMSKMIEYHSFSESTKRIYQFSVLLAIWKIGPCMRGRKKVHFRWSLVASSSSQLPLVE